VAKEPKLGATDADIVRAIRANAERCARAENLKGKIACRNIGLDVSFTIREKGAKGKALQAELDKAFRKCRKLYERRDHSREGELISCVAGMDSVLEAFGYKTVYDRSTKDWKAVPINGNGNGRR
jgi:hypothetical protein